MIVRSTSNIDIIQGVIGYGDAEGITDWRFTNTSSGILNILNSTSTNVRVSMLENGNVGIGTTNPASMLDVVGDTNITGIYKKNNRDIVNETSNYMLSSSNLLVPRILTEVGNGSNYVSRLPTPLNTSVDNTSNYVLSTSNILDKRIDSTIRWTNISSGIYYNMSNVGIGTTNPENKLHIYNDSKIIVQNNSSPKEISVSGATPGTISGTFDRFISFPYTGTPATDANTTYTFTTTEILNIDILIIGGGGAGGEWMGGGGGAGGIVYAINQTLPIGTYTVKVGRGGIGLITSIDPPVVGADQNGVESSLMNSNGTTYISFSLGGTSRELRGIGGGAGGSYYMDSVLDGRDGGSGGGCSEGNANILKTPGNPTQPATYWNGSAYVVGGTIGRQNTTAVQDYQAGGGGGLGGQAADYRNGNSGVAINITGTSQFYAAGGGAGQYGVAGTPATTAAGLGGSSIGGNGRIYSVVSNVYFPAPRDQATSGTDGTGSGGGGGAFLQTPYGLAGSGGSGIVIIRYRGMSSSIELIRGNTNDSNTDYKIGNYAGEFKIIASTSSVDTDYIRINSSGASIYNPTGSPQWSTTSDSRIKENIEKASYDKCYDNINKLDIYRFNYISEFNNINKDLRQLGYIAQEVQEIFPKAVSSTPFNNNNISIPDLLTIDISQINYSLYGTVKKLIEMYNDKKNRLERLENIFNTSITSNINMDAASI